MTPVTGLPSRTNDHRFGSTPFVRAAVTFVGLDLTDSPPERIFSVRAGGGMGLPRRDGQDGD
jgi:hypothetical protein